MLAVKLKLQIKAMAGCPCYTLIANSEVRGTWDNFVCRRAWTYVSICVSIEEK